MDNFVLFLIIGFIGAVIGGLSVALKMQQRQIDDLKRELEEMKKQSEPQSKDCGKRHRARCGSTGEPGFAVSTDTGSVNL